MVVSWLLSSFALHAAVSSLTRSTGGAAPAPAATRMPGQHILTASTYAASLGGRREGAGTRAESCWPPGADPESRRSGAASF